MPINQKALVDAVVRLQLVSPLMAIWKDWNSSRLCALETLLRIVVSACPAPGAI